MIISLVFHSTKSWYLFCVAVIRDACFMRFNTAVSSAYKVDGLFRQENSKCFARRLKIVINFHYTQVCTDNKLGNFFFFP